MPDQIAQSPTLRALAERLPKRSFASDNYAGAHPEVLQALAQVNSGHEVSYGDDPYTGALQEVMRAHFGPQASVYPVFNGTGANVVSLMAMTDRWNSVVCTQTAHINVDECGAPEKLGGIKLAAVETPDAKLTADLVATRAIGFGFEHHAEPGVVSLTQSTELGTVYTPQEIADVVAFAHGKGMSVHVDGARLANAAATLGLPLRAFTTDVGVDVVSLGATKNGAIGAEAVVVLNPEAVRRPIYVRKRAGQLPSKRRFISAQFIALFDGDLWLRSATQANAMAQYLAEGVRSVPGARITQPVQANAVFAVVPPQVGKRLRERFRFYTWDEFTGEVRWMCSFDTTHADVDAFVAALKEEMSRA